jgi:D-arabinose 1-dehydrogenase-like Zn-dependent alcohol dehydrogenase
VKALVLHEYGARLQFHPDWPEPQPAAGEVLLKVGAVGVGLTILIMTGTPGLVTRYPRVPGHEIAGEIVALGSGVANLKVGQRATCHFFLTCGQCRFCRSGRENLCRNFSGFLGMARDGGYAEYVCVPARNIVPIPDGVSDTEAAVSADAIATAYHSCVTKARVLPGDDVLVVGAAGGVGIHVVQMAKVCGARVIAADLGMQKLSFTREWGADDVIDVQSGPIDEQVRQLTHGAGVDAVIDVVATRQTMEASIRALGIGGRLAMVGFRPKGMFGEDWDFSVDGILLNRGELEIHGSRYVSHDEIGQTLRLVQNKRIQAVVSRTFTLEQAEVAHEALRSGDTLGRLAIQI